MDLPRLKKQYAFRLSAPSFIYPAGYVENVRQLGPHVDEIELLLLESDPAALPSAEVIAELAHLADRLQITYNVHLPIDIDPAAFDRSTRFAAVERIAAVLALAAPLNPTTCTLHLPFEGAQRHTLAVWQKRAIESLDLLMSKAEIDPRRVSVETLGYPTEWLAPILAAQPCAVCLDVGHVLNAGFDLKTVLDDLRPRISIVHLHAAAEGTDHLALDRLIPSAWAVLQPFLAEFHGSVSLEVFSAARLHASMTCLGRHMGLVKSQIFNGTA